MSNYIDDVRNIIWPVRLPPRLMDLLALKLRALYQEWAKKKQALDDRQLDVSVALVDLSAVDFALVNEYTEREREFFAVKKRFNEKFSHTFTNNGELMVKPLISEDDKRAASEVKQRAYTALRVVHDGKIKQLVAIAEKLAAEQVAQTKLKIPPALLAELEAVGKETE